MRKVVSFRAKERTAHRSCAGNRPGGKYAPSALSTGEEGAKEMDCPDKRDHLRLGTGGDGRKKGESITSACNRESSRIR